MGRDRGWLLGRVRRDRAQAEISGRSGNQQLPVLETAGGVRARLLHSGVRCSLVDAEAPAIVAVDWRMACGGDLRDNRRDTAWNWRRKRCCLKASGSAAGCSRACCWPRELPRRCCRPTRLMTGLSLPTFFEVLGPPEGRGPIAHDQNARHHADRDDLDGNGDGAGPRIRRTLARLPVRQPDHGRRCRSSTVAMFNAAKSATWPLAEAVFAGLFAVTAPYIVVQRRPSELAIAVDLRRLCRARRHALAPARRYFCGNSDGCCASGGHGAGAAGVRAVG